MSRSLPLVFAAGLFATGAAAQATNPPAPASLQPPQETATMCRANGDYYREGARTCIRSAYGPQLATCGRVQNVLNWELSGAACDPPPVRN